MHTNLTFFMRNEMIGDTLRLLRVFNDYTAVQLANELDLSQSYISEIENGKKTPTLQVIEKYAEFFNIKPSTILLFSEALDKENKSEMSRKQRVAYAGMKYLKLLEKIGGLENE